MPKIEIKQIGKLADNTACDLDDAVLDLGDLLNTTQFRESLNRHRLEIRDWRNKINGTHTENAFILYLNDKVSQEIGFKGDSDFFEKLSAMFSSLPADQVKDQLESLVEAMDDVPPLSPDSPREEFNKNSSLSEIDSHNNADFPSLLSGRVKINEVLPILKTVKEKFDQLEKLKAGNSSVSKALAAFNSVFKALNDSKETFPHSSRPFIDYDRAEKELRAATEQLDRIVLPYGSDNAKEVLKEINDIKNTLTKLIGDYGNGISKLDGAINKKMFGDLTSLIKEFIGDGNKNAMQIIDELNKKIQSDKHYKKSGFGSSRIGGFDPTSFRNDLTEVATNLRKLVKNDSPQSSRITQIADALVALSDYHAWYITENHKPIAAYEAAMKWKLLETKVPGTGFNSSKEITGGVSASFGPVSIGGEFKNAKSTSSNTDIDGSPNLISSNTDTYIIKAGINAGPIVGAEVGPYHQRGKIEYSEFYDSDHIIKRAFKTKQSSSDPGNSTIYEVDTKNITHHRKKFHETTISNININTSSGLFNAIKNGRQKLAQTSSSNRLSADVIGRLEEGTLFVAPGSRPGRTVQCIIDKDPAAIKLRNFLKAITNTSPIVSGIHVKLMDLQGAIMSRTWGARGNVQVGSNNIKATASLEGRTSSRDFSFYFLIAPHKQIEKLNTDPESRRAWVFWRNLLNTAPQLKEYCRFYQEQDVYSGEASRNKITFDKMLGKLKDDFSAYSSEIDRLSAATAAIIRENPLESDIDAFVDSMSKLNDTFCLRFSSLPSKDLIVSLKECREKKDDLLELAYAIIGESFAAISMAAAAVNLQAPENVRNEDLEKIKEIMDSIDRCDFQSIDAAVIHGHSPLLMAKDIKTESRTISVNLGFFASISNPIKISEHQKIDFNGEPVNKVNPKTKNLEPDNAINSLQGPPLSFRASATYTAESYNRTHTKPIRAGSYTKHQIDFSLALSGFGVEIVDALVKQVKDKISKVNIPKDDRLSILKQMESASFAESLKILCKDLATYGGSLPDPLRISWIYESHAANPNGKKKKAYSQFSTSVSRGYDISMDSANLGNPFFVNAKVGFKDEDTLTLASPLIFGPDLLMHALRYKDDIKPCIEENTVTGMQGIKQIDESKLTPDEKTQWQAQLQKLQVNLFSDSSSLINLIEEASKADVELPSENSFSWLFQEIKTMQNGTTIGFINEDLRDHWFNDLSPFKSEGFSALLKRAKESAKGKSPEKLLAYFRDDEDGKKLMDIYFQVIQFANHCAGVASVDTRTEPAWKPVERAAITIIPTLERDSMKGTIKRANKQLSKLSNVELDEINELANDVASKLNNNPHLRRPILSKLANSEEKAEKHLANIINSTKTELPKLRDKLHAVDTIVSKKLILPESMKKPEAQAMLKRFNDSIRKEKWDANAMKEIGAAAARKLYALQNKGSQNMKSFISEMNNTTNVYEKIVSKIMNSGSGGFLRSPESYEKFKVKLEALCDAIELQMTTPMTGNKYRPGSLGAKSEGKPQ
jgi:hypothetical protein